MLPASLARQGVGYRRKRDDTPQFMLWATAGLVGGQQGRGPALHPNHYPLQGEGLACDAWARRGKITVVVDPPIEPRPQAERTGSGVWAEALRLRDAVRARILSRSGEPDLEHERVEI